MARPKDDQLTMADVFAAMARLARERRPLVSTDDSDPTHELANILAWLVGAYDPRLTVAILRNPEVPLPEAYRDSINPLRLVRELWSIATNTDEDGQGKFKVNPNTRITALDRIDATLRSLAAAHPAVASALAELTDTRRKVAAPVGRPRITIAPPTVGGLKIHAG